MVTFQSCWNKTNILCGQSGGTLKNWLLLTPKNKQMQTLKNHAKNIATCHLTVDTRIEKYMQLISFQNCMTCSQVTKSIFYQVFR